ncbi:GGDEF domain-containing protein [Mesobacterium pallidum]|uniref:GGDEF domain-containing protein n=1 Tax=Mesobacterium pallidum TaxID=2872037 RepID=UPI001EE27B57|nr:GGDEF domain-containing protein [Mesobacterium pallidum]
MAERFNSSLDILCPMHVRLSASGHILHVGPTLAKLRPGRALVGERFLEVFRIERPRVLTSVEELRRAVGSKLHLEFRDPPRSGLKGVAAHAGEELVVNLSFGINILDGVEQFSLTSGDFASTDLTVEMLYLIEAKTAAMEAMRDMSLRMQGAKIAAEEQAYTDTLTGLKNRRAMDHVLDRMIRLGHEFAVMHLDLDYFKTVNDTFGHAAGDHVLQQVARILVDETRDDDTVARVGGDEFVLIFDRLADRGRLESIAQRMISRLEKPIRYQDNICRISASAGTALSSFYDVPDAAQMLDDADAALYMSKRRGRAQHCFFDPGLPDLGDGSTTAAE